MATISKINDILCANVAKLDDILKANAAFWDDNSFCPAASPTPTPTITVTPTITPTPTVTPTITPTITPTPTPTNTPTPTVTPTITPTITPTVTPTITPTITPTPTVTPSGGVSSYKYEVTSCCDGSTIEIVEVTSPLNSGDVFLDTNGNCWEVTAQSSGTATVTYVSDQGSCRDCVTNNGCVWKIQCCPGYTVTDYVAEGAFLGSIGPGVFVQCSNGLCYEVIGPVPTTPTETIVAVYTDCVECEGSGGDICR